MKVRRVLLLDSDVVALGPLDPIFAQLRKSIGMVREQSTHLQLAHGTAFNGGLQLFDLPLIRADKCYYRSMRRLARADRVARADCVHGRLAAVAALPTKLAVHC